VNILKTNNFGTPIYNNPDIIELLYQGFTALDKICVASNNTDIERFNSNADIHLNVYNDPNISMQQFDFQCQQQWFMPDEYKTLDIKKWVIGQCGYTDFIRLKRVKEELNAFEQKNMLDLLRWLKYFVDTCRENKIVWGVGRGSSVSSYVLFLIGVHKIDCIKYNLDWHEFLR
jgi:DNA polymerase III alpha subunit